MGGVTACPICSQPHATCGPESAVTPVDPYTAARGESNTMADLKEYTYVVNGLVTTAMLSEADAKRLNAKLVTPAVDNAGAPDSAVQGKARTAPNAARTTANKGVASGAAGNAS